MLSSIVFLQQHKVMTKTTPHLIFLHGLLGDSTEWSAIRAALPHFSCIALDLPCHGSAKEICAEDFNQVCDYLWKKIHQAIAHAPYYLIGYSLGGRIALHYGLHWCKNNLEQARQLQGLILEGANLGLNQAQEKQIRWQQDCHWAKRFSQEKIELVLQDWYHQPVFAQLSAQQRLSLIHQRAHNSGQHIAQMLKATSLAKQLDFRNDIKKSDLAIHYFCGEEDQKFSAMAARANLTVNLIPNAGHNAHWENPQAFAQGIEKKIIEDLSQGKK